MFPMVEAKIINVEHTCGHRVTYIANPNESDAACEAVRVSESRRLCKECTAKTTLTQPRTHQTAVDGKYSNRAGQYADGMPDDGLQHA